MKIKFFTGINFAVFMAVLWGFIFRRFFSFIQLEGVGANLFNMAYSFGHAAEMALALWVIITLAMLLPGRIHTVVSILLGSAATLFFIIDLIVYRQFRLHISATILSMAFGPAAGDIFVFPPVMWLQAAGLLFGVVLVTTLLWLLSRYFAKSSLKYFAVPVSILLFVCLISYHTTHAWASFTEYNPITKQVIHLPLAYPLSANKLLQKMGVKVPERMARFEPELMKYPLEFPRTDPQAANPNIIFILLDGWRYDMAGADVAPNIAAFAENSLRFEAHNSNANHTRHGIFSLFYALPGGYWDAAVTDTIGPVFIDVLKQRGYEFGIFASAALTSPEFHKTVFSAVPNLQLTTDGSTTEARDLKITEEFLSFLNTRDKKAPFFSFLFYDSTHAYRYDPEIYPPKFLPADVKNYFQLPSKDDITPLLNQYKNSVGYSDLLVGRVLDALKAQGLLDNTIVVITSDHGEEFNDLGKNYWGHNGNYSPYQTHVPLFIHWPGKDKATYTYTTSHIDIVPTLLTDVFGSTTDIKEYATGVNLFQPDGREFIYMQGDEYAILTDNVITIFRKLGPIETVDQEYNPTDKRIDGHTLRAMLEELSRFKK